MARVLKRWPTVPKPATGSTTRKPSYLKFIDGQIWELTEDDAHEHRAGNLDVLRNRMSVSARKVKGLKTRTVFDGDKLVFQAFGIGKNPE